MLLLCNVCAPFCEVEQRDEMFLNVLIMIKCKGFISQCKETKALEHKLEPGNQGSYCCINAILQTLTATGHLMAYLQCHQRDDGSEALHAFRRVREAHDAANISRGSADDEFVYSVK